MSTSSIAESIPAKTPTKKRESKKPKGQGPKAAPTVADIEVIGGPILTQSKSDETESNNPNVLGLFKVLKEIQIPKYEKNEDNAEHYAVHARSYYTEIYGRLCKYDNIFNMTQGLLARLKGTIYNHLYHVLPELRPQSVLTQEQFRAWRDTHCPDVSDSTMADHRHIAHRFPLDESVNYGVVDMLTIIKREKLAAMTSKEKEQLAREREAKADAKERKRQEAAARAEGRISRCGGVVTKPPELDPLAAKRDEQARTLADTLADHVVDDEVVNHREAVINPETEPEPATSSKRTPIGVVEVKRGQVAESLESATGALKPIAGWFLAAIEDRGNSIYANPQGTLSQLEGFESSLKLIEGHILDIRAAFQSVTDAVSLLAGHPRPSTQISANFIDAQL